MDVAKRRISYVGISYVFLVKYKFKNRLKLASRMGDRVSFSAKSPIQEIAPCKSQDRFKYRCSHAEKHNYLNCIT